MPHAAASPRPSVRRGPRASLALLLLLALLASTLLVAGCGGKEEAKQESYSSAMRAAARDFDEASRLSAELPPDATEEQRKEALVKQAKLMRATHERIRTLDPPADIASTHRTFVSALGRYVDLLDELAVVIGDSSREGEVYAKLSDTHVVEDLRGAAEKLEDAGYDFQVK